MKCSSRLLCGFLMSWLCFRGSSEELTVNQSPSNITVNEGDSAQISCCWKTINEHSVKVVWYINETRLSGVKDKLQEHQTQNCSTLHLTNILKNHTGHYVCEVTQDIPVLLKVNGTGTDISVRVRQLQKTTTGPPLPQTTQTTESTSTNLPSDPILPLSLAAAIVLVTLCLTFSLCKMRNSCKTSERVVIRQTPHSEGEEHEHMEEEDGSTGSSRGSLQWYQVPVYWSYFDLQRGAEDK
ncbi:uncharacterized protein LOC130069388 isoform X2 [Rhinichthys klamathensis goyatoka]|uniref:uncharacterized protein LOC130069388 isoform X2 n=1 Tax=Rhinichthys klamathensis goyatoka TaxID=3034132 RepID=UPI0024B4CDDD|nr:uncharacterized protein LOC130069388 isoform X2 [Rhinichthys klamathensis goyatoka]